MTPSEAKRTGAKHAVKAAAVGLLIAQLIMMSVLSEVSESLSDAFLWFRRFGFGANILTGVFLLLVAALVFGRIAGVQILIKERNYILTGIICGLLTLLTGALAGSLVGFFADGISEYRTVGESAFDYIVKPVYWILLFGAIPVLLTGIWLGWRIANKRTETTTL
jgi:hypothetical protein